MNPFFNADTKQRSDRKEKAESFKEVPVCAGKKIFAARHQPWRKVRRSRGSFYGLFLSVTEERRIGKSGVQIASGITEKSIG